MAPLDVDMGYAQIQCLSCDLEVALTSSAQFAPSAKDDIIASLRRELNEQTEIATNGNAPYIRSGDSFKLVLSLQVDPTLEPASEDRLSHILVQQIQNAEVDTACNARQAVLTLSRRSGANCISPQDQFKVRAKALTATSSRSP